MKQPDKFNKKLNLDTATAEKIKETNEKLQEYLEDKGEVVASEQVKYLIKNQATSKTEDPKKNTVYDKLLLTNNKILAVIEKMYRDMYDEQDTTIKSTPKAAAVSSTTINNYYSSGDGGNMSGGSGGSDSSDGFDFDIDRRRKKPGNGKKPRKPKKPTKPGKPTSKVGKIGNILEKGKSAGKKVGSAAKAGGKTLLKSGARTLAGGAKFIPGVGLAVGAGMALYDAYEGFTDEGASENLGIDSDKLTTGNKAASAAGSVISGLTFGLADAGDTSKGINRAFGGDEVVEKYEKLGVIDYDVIGDSEIKDWKKFGSLMVSEMNEIVNLDDWDEKDLKRMKQIISDKVAELAEKRSEYLTRIKQQQESFRDKQNEDIDMSPKDIELFPKVKEPKVNNQPYGWGDGGEESAVSNYKSSGLLDFIPSADGKPLTSFNSSSFDTSGSATNLASSMVGKVKYVWGGKGDNIVGGVIGMDCSGFVQYVMKKARGIKDFPVGTKVQLAWLRENAAKVNYGEHASGDIVFFPGANHVGIIEDSDHFIHSSGGSKNTAYNPGKGVTRSVLSSYTKNGAKIHSIWRIPATLNGDPIAMKVDKAGGMPSQALDYSSVAKNLEQPNIPIQTKEDIEAQKNASNKSQVATNKTQTPQEGAKSVKNATRIASSETTKKNIEDTIANSMKEIRENMIQNSSTALAANMKAFQNNSNTAGVQSLVQSLQTNINNMNSVQPKQDNGQDRILNYFS